MQELVSLQMYLDASPGGSDPDPTIATYVSLLSISCFHAPGMLAVGVLFLGQ